MPSKPSTRPPDRRTTKPNPKTWANRYVKKRQSILSISQTDGVSYNTVRKTLIAAGVELRSRGRPPGEPPVWYREALVLRKYGWSLERVGDHFGVSKQAVDQAVKREEKRQRVK